MLDQDLSGLYDVPTKRLNEQVKRNIGRFPADFMFQLTSEEFENLKSQIATSSWGGRRVPPYAFTEHGVLMLSSVLNSERAINVNIQIMRIYTRMREMLMTNQEILFKLEQLEKQTLQNTEDIQVVFDHLKQFLIPVEQAERRWIGFRRKDEQDYRDTCRESGLTAAGSATAAPGRYAWLVPRPCHGPCMLTGLRSGSCRVCGGAASTRCLFFVRHLPVTGRFI